jgi:GT2 family glycosyltransferase
MIQVSIVIVSYNTEKLLFNCIKSIYDSVSNLEIEIIVVDNASTDNSVALIRESFPHVQLILSNKNVGFGPANNIGILQARGKYVFLLNSDTILIKNSIINFLNFMEDVDNIKVACCGGVLLDSELKEQNSFGNFPSIFQTFFELGFNKIFTKYYNEKISIATKTYAKNIGMALQVDYVSGAALFIRKSILDKYEGFDEDFFFYFEETELQKRFRRQGYYSSIIPNSEIIHIGGMSTASNFQLEMMEKGKVMYFRKCHGEISVVFIKIIYTLKYILEVLKNRNTNLAVKKIKFLLNS